MPQTDSFQKNIDRWALFCPQEAAKLAELDASEVSITNGQMLIGSGEDAFLCQDPDNPMEEAVQAVQSINTRNIEVIYVFGVGAGYIYDALKEWLRGAPNRNLVFLERDLRVIKQLFHTDRGTEILNDSQVWLYHLDKECKVLDKITTIFVLREYSVLTLKRYIDRNHTDSQQENAKLSLLINLRQQALYEYLQLGWGYFQNFFHNLLRLPDAHPANEMYGRFHDIPAIICGAGPSLAKNLHLLEGLKDRALIFAGGTAMNAVNADGFVPHFGVGIDPNPEQFTRIITNIAFETPYFYRNRLNHKALNLIHGDHLYVPGSGGYIITKWLEEQLGIFATDLTEGCNVINFSTAIADAMGCSPIICVGVDLAYSNEQPYAPGVLNHPIHNRREFFKTKNEHEELIIRKDIHGKGVYTLWKWIMESFWFSTFSLTNPRSKLVNATEGGLGFFHIPNMTLQEAADRYLTKQYDFSGLVHAEVQRAGMPPDLTREAIENELQNFYKSLETCSTLISTIHQEIRILSSDHNKGLSTPEEMLSPTAKDSQEALEKEVAYIHFLKVFEEAFMKWSDLDYLRLDIEKDVLEPQKIREQKYILFARKYQFLHDTCSANIKHMQKAVEAVEVRNEQFASLAADYVPPPQPVINLDEGQSVDLTAKDIEKHEKHDKSGALLSTYYTKGGLLHGPFTHYDDRGHIMSKSHFIHGLREGISVFYYPTGNIASVQHFEKGLAEGLQLYYFPDGTVKASIRYQEGRLHGDVKQYDKFGRLIRELAFINGRRNGAERLWNEEGMLVVEAFFKDNGPIDKARKWHDNGNLALEITYDEEGNVISTRNWNVDGLLVIEGEESSEDYFDRVTRQTNVLTQSIDNIVSQVAGVAPIFVSTIGSEKTKNDFKRMENEIAILKENMAQLKEISSELMFEAGMDPVTHKEPLWKSPSSRHELEKLVRRRAARCRRTCFHCKRLLQGLWRW